MWRFLDSANAGFKWKKCEERGLVESELARVLEEGRGRERWRERMENLV